MTTVWTGRTAPPAHETFGNGHGRFTFIKWHMLPDGTPDYTRDPMEVVRSLNAFVNGGGVLLLHLLAGAGGTAFGAGTYIGFGDSSVSTTASMTDLQAATNKAYVVVTGAPTLSGQTMTWTATIGSGVGEGFAIAEAGLFNAAMPGGTMLCRSTGTFGTKGTNTVWTATYTATVP